MLRVYCFSTYQDAEMQGSSWRGTALAAVGDHLSLFYAFTNLSNYCAQVAVDSNYIA